MSNNDTITIKDTIANPAPLGLMGFGMTTVLLNIHNAGFFPIDTMIMGMGIFYGGLAQIIAGIMEFKKNNTFGATAFTSYGLFWLSLVAMLVMPATGLPAFNHLSKGMYLLMWGVFTFIMYFGTLKATKALQTVFFSLFVLFFLLAIHDFTESETIGMLAGYEGIFCGCSAIYCGLGQVLNEVHKKTVFPLG